MRKYFQLVIDPSLDKFCHVADYTIEAFDLTLFWKGEKIQDPIPSSVKLFVDKKTKNMPDLMGNPLSWLLCSKRLIDCWYDYINQDVQIFDAPIYQIQSNIKVKNYFILNPISCLKSVNLDRSTYIGDKEDIRTITEYYLYNNAIPESTNIFRPKEFKQEIIVSEKIVKISRKANLIGPDYIECHTDL